MVSIQFIILSSIIIGMIIGTIGTSIIIFRSPDALLGIDTTRPDKDRYNFVILCPLDELNKKKYLVVEIKKRL